MIAAGAYILYYFYQKSQGSLATSIAATGTDPTLVKGPTRYLDPLTSAQAGGSAGGAFTLRDMSQYGPS